MWTVDLQCRRLGETDKWDGCFVFRRIADFDFLVIALMRLRRAAVLAGTIDIIRATIGEALGNFDSAVPQLKRCRDVAEHIDDYAVDRGKDRSIGRTGLEVFVLEDTGGTVTWLGNALNATVARSAAKQLFDAIKGASGAFPSIAYPPLEDA